MGRFMDRVGNLLLGWRRVMFVGAVVAVDLINCVRDCFWLLMVVQ